MRVCGPVRLGTRASRGISAVAATIGCVALLVCTPAALASVDKTIDFQSPVITEEQFVEITNQYGAEGLAFISPSEGPVAHPQGSGDEPFAQADLERESGAQLITGYEHEGIDGPGECVKAWSDLAGRLTKSELGEFSTKISIEVGADSSIFDKSGGGKIILDAYSGHGEFLGSREEDLKPGETKHLEVKEPAGEIAYFYVIAPNGGSCEHTPVIALEEVSFTVPSPLPKEVLLEPRPEPGESGLAGSQGGTAKLPIRVFRENGAEGELALHVSGLPSGVTVSDGSSTIPAGASSATLELAIAQSAATGEVPITITATSPAKELAAEPAPIHTHLSVSAPLSVYLNGLGSTAQPNTELTAGITPCGGSGAAVTIGFGPGVSGEAALSLSASGDTSGLSYSLARTTVASGSSEPVTLDLSEAASSATGTADVTVTATDGSLKPSIAVLVVNRETGTITSVSSSGQDPFGRLPETPQLLAGGSEVRIQGSGLCPGSTVQFGNEQATATPSEFGPGGSLLVVSIPRLATSGTVTVLTPAGNLQSPHSLSVDDFRNEWGWGWENGNTPKYLSYALIESIFGREESTSWLDSEWPSVDARLFKGYASGLLEEGSCLGMVGYLQYLSQYSKDPEGLGPIEGSVPRSGEDPYSFQTGPIEPGKNAAREPSAPLEELISIFHFDQFSAQFIEFEFEEHEASHPPLYVVEQLKRSLAESAEYGDLNFDFLTMQNEGPEGGGHAVVPYGLEGDGHGGYYIDVYNPNRPYYSFESNSNGAAHRRELEESRIHVAANGEWTFKDGFEEQWHGDEESLVYVPWGKLPVPVAVPIPELSGHAERPEIPSLETGLKLLATWIGISSSGSNNSITQVTDSSGHTLVGAGGTPNRNAATRIHHGQLHFSLTGTRGASPSAWLPAGGSYTVTETAKHDGPYSATVLGDHLDALVTTTAATGTSDKIGVSSSTHSFSFAAGSTKPVTLSVAAAAGKGSSHTAQLETTSPAGSTQTLGFKGNTLVYAHTGPAVTIDLQLSSSSGSKAPVALNTGPIRLAAGQRASVAPTAWGTLGAARITISGHGSSRTIVVHNKSALRPPLRKLSLSVRRDGGPTRSLTIAGRLDAVPAGAQLQYTWRVTEKGHVVARHELTLSGASLHHRDQHETFDFTAPADGDYRFTGTVSLLVTNGLIEQGSASSRSMSVIVG
jgi:hypothetical protein